jgi:ATP/maltotriose-dependent transcriptional regulator MalT
MAGLYEMTSPDGSSHLDLTYYALADALPGLHLIAFAPADWPEGELVSDTQLGSGAFTSLTPRELEVLELAADGHNAPKIAEELVVSVATVRTHFGNIYGKLGVGDRASAVAKAMRLGLIA